MRRLLPVIPFLFLFTACRGGASGDEVRDFAARRVTLPDGTRVRAEVMSQEKDMMRGMMFRDSLPEGQGMLFIHARPGTYSYWMYQVRIPLDIVWMDARGRVVEVSENTPPCKAASANDCPNYGGTQQATVVLELPGGSARKHAVVKDSVIQF